LVWRRGEVAKPGGGTFDNFGDKPNLVVHVVEIGMKKLFALCRWIIFGLFHLTPLAGWHQVVWGNDENRKMPLG
jgi:hypothetical protein